jgi:urate oxidase
VIELGEHHYGKQSIRLVKVVGGANGHAVRDLTIGITLDGSFERAYTAGDNSAVVATDTMKNTAYALAKDRLTGSIEDFGLALGQHLRDAPSVERATVELREHHWTRLRPGEDAFRRDGEMTRTASVSVGADGSNVRAGVADLVLMKTAKSSFSGFPRDPYTTLRETEDRIMATRLTGDWAYASDPEVDYEVSFTAVLETLLDSFAEHVSRSVQETIWILGRAILERHEAVDEVHLSLPNLHHWIVDLSPFGLENDGEIFVATSEPFGSIEATVRRGG